MSQRHCAIGYHWAPLERFRTKANGTLARDCMACEEKRRRRKRELAGHPSGVSMAVVPAAPTAEFPGVDIDAINYKLGRVNGKKRAA